MRNRKSVKGFVESYGESSTGGSASTSSQSNTHTTSSKNTETSYVQTGVCTRLFQLFDCIWAIILLMISSILAISFSPQMIKQIFQIYLHRYLYSVVRYSRFIFLHIHPYLVYIGMDLTNSCLIENPTVSNINKCPCINQPYPIVVPINYTSLPAPYIHDNILNSYILTSAIPTHNKPYGYMTLLEYSNLYRQVPNACSISHSGSKGPLSVQNLIEESDWERWSNSSWSLSWGECMDPAPPAAGRPYFSSLLPSLESSLFSGHGVQPVSYHYYISTQWSKVYDESSVFIDVSHISVLAVLQGAVRVTTSVKSDCWEYCDNLDRGNLLIAGDVLLYDKRYWTFTGQTWSNNSFMMLTEMKI